MRGWPKLDADLILYFEIILMSLFLTMNGADYTIQLNYPENDIMLEQELSSKPIFGPNFSRF